MSKKPKEVMIKNTEANESTRSNKNAPIFSRILIFDFKKFTTK